MELGYKENQAIKAKGFWRSNQVTDQLKTHLQINANFYHCKL